MEFLAQFGDLIGTAVLAVLVWFYLRGRLELLERHLDGRIDDLKQDMNRRFEQNDRQHERFAGEMAALRSDLTQVALVVGARTRPQANEA